MRKIPLATALTTLAIAATAAPAGAAEGVTEFVSNPSLKPPTLIVNTSEKGQSPGFIFLSSFANKFIQKPLVGDGGPMIVDNRGRYVWLHPQNTGPDTLNLNVGRYQGKPVLAWWNGTVGPTGEMHGQWFIANDRYKVIQEIKDANGWDLSAHEIHFTSKGTVLITGYRKVDNQNLTSVGGSESQSMFDSGVVEYDVKTGKLVREWSGMAHIPNEDSYTRTAPNAPAVFDPTHINSIDVDAEGNWLISMRNTWAIYKVNGATGDIIWTLGGKRSTFTFGDKAAFAFQHSGRFQPNGRISLFDNECCALIPQPSGPPKAADPVNGQSRGLRVQLDEAAKTATLVDERTLYQLVSGTQGNLNILPNGHWFIGWGQQPFFSEHDEAGKLLLSIRFPDPDISYRAYRSAWVGKPTERPRGAARVSGSRTRVYASWNGATEIAAWRFFGGKSSRKLKVLAKRVKRQGFETSALIKSAGPVFKAQALNSKGKVIGTTRAFKRIQTTGTEPAPSY